MGNCEHPTIRNVTTLIDSINSIQGSILDELFPHKNLIHAPLNPLEIVTGSHTDYHKRCKLQFVSYIQVKEQYKNSLLPRTSGAIAL